MTDQSRKLILTRRTNPIENFQNAVLESFGVSIDEALKIGIYKVNSSHQIGIATASEGGLAMNRFPIRVLIETTKDNDRRFDMDVDTCVSYWKVTNSANQAMAFQRKALSSEVAVSNLYKIIPDIDNILWDHWEAIVAKCRAPGVKYLMDFDATQEATRDQTYALLNVANIGEEQAAAVVANVANMVAVATAANRVVALKVDEGAYMRGIPHGVRHSSVGAMTADSVMLREVALALLVNSGMIKSRWPDCPTGVALTGAYASASMFRYGVMEAFTHKEFVTIVVTPEAASNVKFTISKVDAPPGYDFPESLSIGKTLDITPVKIHPKVSTVGSLLVWIAGLMHYLYNHTTGGSKVSGPMLTVCTMFGLLNVSSSLEEQEMVTNVLYESVHPVNKRAVANIHFPTSKVYTHGKLRGSYMYERMELDAFAAIRRTPYPAGSHKAYVASQAFKKVVMAGLGPFVPFNDQLDVFINSCKEILSQGARAHIGALYYTGCPPISQSSSLDNFMPDLARYMQTFHANDSLTGSPHLSAEVAAKASATWNALLKDIKSKDVSAIPAEKVKEFLANTGIGGFGFDPEDKLTWAVAANKSKDALRILNNIFE